MKVTILGCGGAGGVPSVSAGWGACDPAEPRNRRRRPSILVEDGETAVLVDTSPDLREQLLDAGVRRLDGVVYTHDHADHLHGLDDLREINRAMQAGLAIHGSAQTLETIRTRFGYALGGLEEGAASIYRPILAPVEITGPFSIGSIQVTPLDQDHGYARTLGLHFGPVAYSTDAVDLPEETFEALAGVPVWIIGCLLDYPHPTHAHVDKVIAWVERVRPGRAFITHMGTRLDYQTLCRRLPAHVRPAHDGLMIESP